MGSVSAALKRSVSDQSPYGPRNRPALSGHEGLASLGCRPGASSSSVSFAHRRSGTRRDRGYYVCLQVVGDGFYQDLWSCAEPFPPGVPGTQYSHTFRAT